MKIIKILFLTIKILFLQFKVFGQEILDSRLITLFYYKNYDLDSILEDNVELTDRNYWYDQKNRKFYYRIDVNDTVLKVIDLINEKYTFSKINIPVTTNEDLYSSFLVYNDTLHLIVSSPYDENYGMKVLYYDNFKFYEKYNYFFVDSKPPAFDMCYFMNVDSIGFQDFTNCEITTVYKSRKSSQIKNRSLIFDSSTHVVNINDHLQDQYIENGCRLHTCNGELKVLINNEFLNIIDNNNNLLLKFKNKISINNMKITTSAVYGIRNQHLIVFEIGY